MNVKKTRWTVQHAATEFGVNRETLTTKLKATEVIAGEDGKYSTQQICHALFNDASAEKVRLLREQSRKLKLDNDRKAGEQVDADTVFKAYEGVFVCLRQTILASNLTDEEKSECLANLRHDVMEAKPIE